MKNGIYKPASAYADDGIACLRMYNIDQGKIVWRDVKRMLLTQQDLDEYGLHSGDLLVNRVNSRELVGKSAVIPEWQEPVVFESKNIRVRVDNKRALPKFLNYQLLLNGSRYFATNAQQVVGMASINQKQLADFPIVLPSLHRQEEVVAEIEKQLSRLDEAVTALKLIQANLKRYKAAVLKAAVEGKLTEKWRKEHPNVEPADQLLKRILAERRAKWEAEELAKMNAKGFVGARHDSPDSLKKKYKEPVAPDTTNLPELPEGWVWATYGQAGYLKLGRQRAPKYHTGPNMRPYLRVQNVFEDRIDLSDVMEMDFPPDDFKKYQLQSGDLLLNEGQSPELLGRPAIYRGELPGACFTNTLIRFRAVNGVSVEFALAVSRHYMRARRFVDEGTITTNIAHLSLGRLATVEFPMPSFAEQQAIVAEVGRVLSVTEELEATIKTNLKRAERLRQTILHQAFSGEMQ